MRPIQVHDNSSKLLQDLIESGCTDSGQDQLLCPLLGQTNPSRTTSRAQLPEGVTVVSLADRGFA